MVQEGKDVVRKINKIDKRINNGKVFPPAMTKPVEASLIALDLEQKKQQGSLICIDELAMLGGDILAGNNFCSEKGLVVGCRNHQTHDTGKVLSNFKGSLYNLSTGNYNLFGIPVPTGHI
jgi:hypothetical protein